MLEIPQYNFKSEFEELTKEDGDVQIKIIKSEENSTFCAWSASLTTIHNNIRNSGGDGNWPLLAKQRYSLISVIIRDLQDINKC